ncbi:hypothetical protein [Paenibacillus xylanexedens]|uniref:hypothetical protein n=1 Tax=Paenibacillus xylanexedens TaxID=528191 RepID=UPI003B012428
MLAPCYDPTGSREDDPESRDNGPRHGLDKDSGKPWQKSIETDHCRVISLEWNRYFLSDPLSAVLQAEEMADRIMAY